MAVNALAAHEAVTIGTQNWSAATNMGLYANHAYAITGYNASTNTFTLYNPWGFDQPGPLTWAQLQATCTQLCACSTSGTVPFLNATKAGSAQAGTTAGISLSAQLAATGSQPAIGQGGPSSASGSVAHQRFWSLAFSGEISSQSAALSDGALGAMDTALVDAALAGYGVSN